MHGFDKVVRKIKSSEGTLFILCGYPYSGKSYIARQLQRETDIALVSIDDIFHEYGFDWNADVLPNTDEWGNIFNESYEQVRRKLMKNMNVLYDSTNHTVESRDALRKVAEPVGSETFVIYVAENEETVWQRWKENATQKHRPHIRKELVEETIKAFEEPIEKENTLIIQN